MINDNLFGNDDVNLDSLCTEEAPAMPVYILEAVCMVSKVRNRYIDNDCELSVINQTLFKHNVTPTQEIYDEVFSQL